MGGVGGLVVRRKFETHRGRLPEAHAYFNAARNDESGRSYTVGDQRLARSGIPAPMIVLTLKRYERKHVYPWKTTRPLRVCRLTHNEAIAVLVKSHGLSRLM